ncbi:hypothetical protein C8Q78DRAFT_1057598 [Trametes maxima]|nr:hypothetical protein C8Q78DRAFT_1057598 [Trametes maxima]
MSDHNDARAYGDAPHDSFFPDASQSPGRPTSAYPPSVGRRAPRYSRATNASWVSNGLLSPPLHAGPPSVAGSRPPRVTSPTPSNGLSDFHPQHPSPDELGREPDYYNSAGEYRGPGPYPGPPGSHTGRGSYGGQGPEPEEWDPETERMTIGASVEDNYPYEPYQDHQPQFGREDVPRPPLGHREDSFYDPIAPAEPTLEPEPRMKKKNTFVGGFIAGLRKLPTVMVRSHFHDRKSTRKGAPGTELPTGPSHYLPAYDEPGVTVIDPASLQYVETGVPLSASPRSLSQTSHFNVTRPTSGTHTQRLSSQSVPRSSIASQGPPRIITAPVGNPVVVNPQLASDYAKMPAPHQSMPANDSFKGYYDRIKQLVQDLQALPWQSSPVAPDYEPPKSHRASPGKTKPGPSWYSGTTGPHQEIDLLGSARPAPRRLRSEDGGAGGGGGASVRSGSAHVAIAHDGRTPASFVTSPGQISSPGMSSHGQGQHPMSFSYYFAPPQPLYVYQSPMTTPLSNPPGLEGSSSSSSSPPPAAPGQDLTPQAVPVYMMAGPPPGLLPSPPPQAHTPGHHREAVGSPSGPPPGLPVPTPAPASG